MRCRWSVSRGWSSLMHSAFRFPLAHIPIVADSTLPPVLPEHTRGGMDTTGSRSSPWLQPRETRTEATCAVPGLGPSELGAHAGVKLLSVWKKTNQSP